MRFLWEPGRIVRPEIPEKWDDSQVGFWASNASGGHLVLLRAFWAHGASKMALSLKALNSLISGSRPFWPYFPSDY